MTAPVPVSRSARWVYLGVGWLFFAIGVLGAFLPVLPTTLPMIIALWAFSKSSARLQHWLYTHRLFGPSLQRWHEHRVIPLSAKFTALVAMAASFAYLVLFTETPWPYELATAAFMLAGAVYILTKPSQAPVADEVS
jgi:hypothetical protein